MIQSELSASPHYFDFENQDSGEFVSDARPRTAERFRRDLHLNIRPAIPTE